MDTYKILPFIFNKSKCTGCGACFNICPLHCIKMFQDEEGFLYPMASDACVKCGQCERICPQIYKPQTYNLKNKKAFAAISKDDNIWRRSSSGGAFSEICKSFSDTNTMIVGAVWNKLKVEHKCVIGMENVGQLCKSKYIASDTNNVYKNIRKHLDNREKVIFCGTPCQVSGLKKYLKKEYRNLLLIDLICHGVGSPKVFESCIQIMNEEFGGTIVSYEFRAKKKVFKENHIQKLLFKDKNRSIYVKQDPYIQLFLSQLCLRPCCGSNCQYRTEFRQGDITIADFKGLEKVFPELLGTKRNYSSIIFNTEKGLALLPDLQENMVMYECTLKDIKTRNPLFFQQTESSGKREAFFLEYQNNPINTIKQWTNKTQLYKRSIFRKIYDMCPIYVRKLVLCIFSRVRWGDNI